MEDTNRTTYEENYRFRFGILDASAIVPLPLLGYFPSMNMLYVALSWWVVAGILAYYDRSMMDILKILWHRRSKTCHSRLKNNR